MKVKIVLEAEVSDQSDELAEALERLQSQRAPVVMVEQTLVQKGAIRSTDIRVSEVSIDGEPVQRGG